MVILADIVISLQLTPTNRIACYATTSVSNPMLASLVPRPLPYFISQPYHGEKLGEGLGSKLRHGLEMVDSVSTNRVHVTY